MKVPLRVLHVDDNPIDVRLPQAFLVVSGIECDVVRIDTMPALDEALQQGRVRCNPVGFCVSMLIRRLSTAAYRS